MTVRHEQMKGLKVKGGAEGSHGEKGIERSHSKREAKHIKTPEKLRMVENWFKAWAGEGIVYGLKALLKETQRPMGRLLPALNCCSSIGNTVWLLSRCFPF